MRPEFYVEGALKVLRHITHNCNSGAAFFVSVSSVDDDIFLYEVRGFVLSIALTSTLQRIE